MGSFVGCVSYADKQRWVALKKLLFANSYISILSYTHCLPGLVGAFSMALAGAVLSRGHLATSAESHHLPAILNIDHGHLHQRSSRRVRVPV